MIKFYIFVINLIILASIYAYASDTKELFFKKHLLSWNIDYSNLALNKAGAICYPFEDKIEALGFSFQMADIDYAKKIALEGCNQMKKKNKIISHCKCEIIFINNNYVGGKKIVK